MTLQSSRARLAAPAVAAAGLAVVLVALAVVAARTLHLRDQAVRDGLLVRLGHELEAGLREAGPDGTQDLVESFLDAHRLELRGVEVVLGQAVFARAGATGGQVLEIPVFPGPAWRGRFGDRPFDPRFRRMPLARLQVRLYPADHLGRSRGLGFLLVAGSLAAGLALLGFAGLAVRGLAHRQRLAAAEAERQRLAAVALAGAGLAHRIRNPLAAIKGTAQLLVAQGEGGVAERAARIVAASDRIDTLVGRLLEFARPPEPHPEACDLRAVVRDTAARAVGPVEVQAGPPVAVVADREQVEAVVEELLANARAFDPTGTIQVTVEAVGRTARVEVLDRGAGLSVDPEEAFAPYVTTRPDGTGLGLAIVRALALANGGEVRLSARPGGGCTAAVVLPVREG